jgi:(p)ppGpp synthase/HD superfamily hydrolase
MPESTAHAPVLGERFQRAFSLASEVHARQVRKGTQIPYLAHLMSVAALVLENGGDEDAAVAGLLHDAVEDSDDGAAMAERIRGDFGDHVARVVLACSDAVAVEGQPKAPWGQRKADYLERLAGESDPAVFLVSACDKLHNARAIVSDLRVVGPELWDRFSQHDPAAHLWYHDSLAACYAGHVPPRLLDELKRAIEEMRSLTSAAAFGQ